MLRINSERDANEYTDYQHDLANDRMIEGLEKRFGASMLKSIDDMAAWDDFVWLLESDHYDEVIAIALQEKGD